MSAKKIYPTGLQFDGDNLVNGMGTYYATVENAHGDMRRLIAAAPDLLAALEAFMPEWDEREQFIEANDHSHSERELKMLARIRGARAAITKAKGQA